jgi:hypothetical protein
MTTNAAGEVAMHQAMLRVSSLLAEQVSDSQSDGDQISNGSGLDRSTVISPELIHAFLREEADMFDRSGKAVVWNPMCADGMISRCMRSAGITVFSSDNQASGIGTPNVDFLALDVPIANSAVFRPRSAMVDRCVRHAIDRLQLGYVACLIETDFWGTPAGRQLKKDIPPTFVYLSTWNAYLDGREMAPGGVGWCVWLGRWRGETELRFLSEIAEADSL